MPSVISSQQITYALIAAVLALAAALSLRRSMIQLEGVARRQIAARLDGDGERALVRARVRILELQGPAQNLGLVGVFLPRHGEMIAPSAQATKPATRRGAPGTDSRGASH